MTEGKFTGDITELDRDQLRSRFEYRGDLAHAWAEGDATRVDQVEYGIPHGGNPYEPGELHDAWALGFHGGPEDVASPLHSLDPVLVLADRQKTVQKLVADSGLREMPKGHRHNRGAVA